MSSEKTLEGAGLGYPAPPGRAGDFKCSTPKIHAPRDIPSDITGAPLCPGTKDPQASLELPGGFSNEKRARARSPFPGAGGGPSGLRQASHHLRRPDRSEEHTSELQSRLHLVCRLLLEKKKKIKQRQPNLAQ